MLASRNYNVTKKDEIRYRNVLERDKRLQRRLTGGPAQQHGSGTRWMVYGFRFMYFVVTESLEALPLILPYASLFRHRQSGFVARNDKSVLFDERVPPLSSRAKFIIMFCMTCDRPDALAATIRHFRKATDAFPARLTHNEDTGPHSLRHSDLCL